MALQEADLGEVDEQRVSEAELLEGMKAGDVRAFAEFDQLYRFRLVGFALRILKNESWAEDAVQDVLVKVYQNIHSFDGQKSVISWVMKILRNDCLSKLRAYRARGGEHGEYVDGEMGDESFFPAPDLAVERAEISGHLMRAIGKLDQGPKQVMLDRTVEGLSYEDIASLRGLPIGTVKNWIIRAKAALLKTLRPVAAELV